MNIPIAEQVTDAASLLGLLLALDTLFTSEQARRLEAEDDREGGPRKTSLRTIGWTSAALAVLTGCAVAALAPLMWSVVKLVGGYEWEPVLSVFGLAYVLLLGLLGWQIRLTIRAKTH